jgi:hypothetical protein
MIRERANTRGLSVHVPAAVSVAERLYTIPITCRVDGEAHDVTDDKVATGQQTGVYQALYGCLVLPAPMVAPVGWPYAKCTALSVAAQPTIGHHRSGSSLASPARIAVADAATAAPAAPQGMAPVGSHDL